MEMLFFSFSKIRSEHKAFSQAYYKGILEKVGPH